MTLCGSVNVILNHTRRVYYIKHTAMGTGNFIPSKAITLVNGTGRLVEGGQPPVPPKKMGFPPPGHGRDIGNEGDVGPMGLCAVTASRVWGEPRCRGWGGCLGDW